MVDGQWLIAWDAITLGREVSEIINQKGPRERDSISDYPVSSKVGSPADNSTLDRLGQLKKAPPAHSLKFIPQCR